MYDLNSQKWQIISLEQAVALHKLGVYAKCDIIYTHTYLTPDWALRDRPTIMCPDDYNAYNLAEIAVMLGYSFCPSNIREAADKLIDEISIGTTTPIDCNDRLREAKSSIDTKSL